MHCDAEDLFWVPTSIDPIYVRPHMTVVGIDSSPTGCTHNPRVLLSCFCNFALSFFLKILSKHKCNSDPSTNPYSGSLWQTISIKLSPAFKTEETLKFSRVTMIQSKARQQQQDRHNIQTRDSQESRVFQVTISSNLLNLLPCLLSKL